MTPPNHKRGSLREIWDSPDQELLANAAATATYVGSPEHKDTPSFAGRLRPRANATICDVEFKGKQDELTTLIRQGIQAGNVSAYWENKYPRYVWCLHNGDVYEARLTNQGKGEYKGFKLDPDDWPKELR